MQKIPVVDKGTYITMGFDILKRLWVFLSCKELVLFINEETLKPPSDKAATADPPDSNSNTPTKQTPELNSMIPEFPCGTQTH